MNEMLHRWEMEIGGSSHNGEQQRACCSGTLIRKHGPAGQNRVEYGYPQMRTDYDRVCG
ncbi:hypothetical protein JMJ77_0015139, partial [Colletotrichum scovillei]